MAINKYIIIIISGLHHYECVAPLVTNSLQSGRFWARSTASVHDSLWESRSFCTVFIQVIHGHPGGLFQYTEGEEVKPLTNTFSVNFTKNYELIITAKTYSKI